MNSLSMHLAVRCVRWWTRFYTAGMLPEFRETRCAEIESDLWECQSAAASEDRRLGSALHVVLRLLMGIPDDLGWRVDHTALAEAIGQDGVVYSARVAGAALFMIAVWVIHADAVRPRPATAAVDPTVALDHALEQAMSKRARDVRRSAVRVPRLAAPGVCAEPPTPD
jgi:hypothetical protein